jgi:hypothetical protein
VGRVGTPVPAHGHSYRPSVGGAGDLLQQATHLLLCPMHACGEVSGQGATTLLCVLAACAEYTQDIERWRALQWFQQCMLARKRHVCGVALHTAHWNQPVRHKCGEAREFPVRRAMCMLECTQQPMGVHSSAASSSMHRATKWGFGQVCMGVCCLVAGVCHAYLPQQVCMLCVGHSGVWVHP